MATTISSLCSKCGIIAKSGKVSCCGHGGSWFRNCGGAGNTRLQHTWHDGIRSCKARTQPRTGQQANSAQQKGIDPSRGDDKVNSKRVIMAGKPFTIASANMSTSMAVTKPIITADSTSISYDIPTMSSTAMAGVTTTIISVSDNMSTATPMITSVTAQEKLLNVAIHIINLIVTIIVFQR